MSVQTDYLNVEETVEYQQSTLYCWQDSSTNEAATQTSITVNNLQKESKKVFVIEKPRKVCTQSVRVGPDCEMRNGFQWYDDMQDDSSFKQLCGITKYFFHILLNFIKPNVYGQPNYFKVMKAEDRLLMFLMKMKLGLNFVALACLFQISTKAASDIFYSVLETVFYHTETWIFWPSKEAVKVTLPETFKNYPNCRAIIDCTELFCETPPTVEMRASMYSTYKSHFTLKYLVAITPSGYISFVSKGYGGRTSDCIIVNDSGFLTLVEPGDQILADKIRHI